jgi:hypothetical protein
MAISAKEIDMIKQDLTKKGLDMPGLDNDLLDHLLCGIENHMASGHSFQEAYHLASHDLHGEWDIKKIQDETASLLNEGKSLLRNLISYTLIIGILILVFNLLTSGVNPALILVCISLCIFFIYHSLFYRRKQKRLKKNLALFTVVTAMPVMGVALFLVREFSGFELMGMMGWCILIISIAIPVYLNAVKSVLTMDGTILTFFCYTLKLIAVVSGIWIPLALCIKLFRPDVAIFFFLDDLLLLSLTSFVLSAGLRKISDLKLFLLNKF